MSDRHWASHPAVRSGDERTRGERAADRLRNSMGSWAFIFGFLAVMLAWAAVNSLALRSHAFDRYPYILLNLLLSTLAGLQGGILLIAAKREDKIAGAVAVHTAENTDQLKTLLEVNTTLTRALHDHLLDHPTPEP